MSTGDVVVDAPYLPDYATTEEVCAMLAAAVGGVWTLGRLLERGLRPLVMIDGRPMFLGTAELFQLKMRPATVLVRKARSFDGEWHDFLPRRELPLAALRWSRADIEAHPWPDEREPAPTAQAPAVSDEGRKVQMRAMRKSGMTDQAIADHFGVRRQRVAQLIGSKQQNRAAEAERKRKGR